MTEACIIQFGTSRFLQAHVDLFASEAAAAGQNVPGITIVQTSGDPARAARLAAFGQPGGYPVVIRGIGDDGLPMERAVTVTSVRQGLSAAHDWQQLVTLFATPDVFICSNVGDRGYVVAQNDRTPQTLDGETRPTSFPAILLSLLHNRWRNGCTTPITLMPCELVRRNGETLNRIIANLATDIGADPTFLRWLNEECVWVNSLVDRIVSEPIEPIGAIAEPYALWAIEDQPGLSMPFAHPDVVLTDDLEPYERLKLHVLNLGHTWLAQRWIEQGRPADATVRAYLDDPVTAAALAKLLANEVVPGFAAHGLGHQASAYVAQTLVRFRNPFLNHRLADISHDHSAKVTKRVGEFVRWVQTADIPPPLPMLTELGGKDGIPVS